MLVAAEIPAATTASLLGRASPLVKLVVAVVWLVGLATTTAAAPAVALALVAALATVFLGGVRPGRLLVGLGPLLVAAVGIGLTNLLFSGSNTDPAAVEVARLGPLRVTAPALVAAGGIFARVLAIVAVGGSFALTTDPTHLIDALVQQGRLSPRFAYATLAAYQAVPRLGSDLGTLVGARRLRGLSPAWHPRVLVGLLVRAIRHADQLAVALDARGLGSGPRSAYRPVRWGWRDLAVALGGVAALAGVLAAAGT